MGQRSQGMGCWLIKTVQSSCARERCCRRHLGLRGAGPAPVYLGGQETSGSEQALICNDPLALMSHL